MNDTTSPSTNSPHRPSATDTVAALTRRSFAVLSTTSEAGVPHASGVLYEIVGGSMYVNTNRSSRKARNIASSGRAAVCVPIRRLPVGPPSSVQFQARADVVDLDDPKVLDVIAGGGLRSLTRHGELELPDGCFVRIGLPHRLMTYGLGMPLRSLVADPLAAAGRVDVTAWPT